MRVWSEVPTFLTLALLITIRGPCFLSNSNSILLSVYLVITFILSDCFGCLKMAPSIAYPAPSPVPSLSPSHTLSKKPQINIDVVEITENTESILDSTSVQRVDSLDSERARLRAHLGLDSPAPQIQPLFFIEQVPNTTSNIPVKCSLPGCTAGIEPNSLRLALNPGMSGDIWFRSSSGTLTHTTYNTTTELHTDRADRLLPHPLLRTPRRFHPVVLSRPRRPAHQKHIQTARPETLVCLRRIIPPLRRRRATHPRVEGNPGHGNRQTRRGVR